MVAVTATLAVNGRHDVEWYGLFLHMFCDNQMVGVSVPFTAVKSVDSGTE